ncbi:MAG: FAD-binding protein [Deltaproteobacteria bacterium]|nr:MAG: FAD-binding protein [Deltaproteobacteria bacterium]
MERFFNDVMIIGCGAAGLRAAIAAAEEGRNVCVLSKASHGLGTCTVMSRGHFAGARTGWTPEQHRESTLRAGKGLNQNELVDILIQDAPERLDEILRWGLQGVIKNGQLYALGPPPVWGREIVRCLFEKAAGVGVQFRSGLTTARIWVGEGAVGVLCYAAERGEWVGFTSRSLVLATGGAGALFLRHDNPQRMLGEGYALALEAGATLRDMEFFQFLPLATAEPGRPQFPIPSTIASRGRLMNTRGEEILEKHGILERPADVHARDRLSQVLMSEIRNGDSVFLDLSRVSESEWMEDALGSGTILLNRFRAKEVPLRVAPTAHFCTGGVCIDPQGWTRVPGLYAAGEVTGGLHGANRMAGNALSEALVFGDRAGKAASRWAGQIPPPGGKGIWEEIMASISGDLGTGTSRGSAELKKRVRKMLWENGGILRSKEGLLQTIEAVTQIRDEAQHLSLKTAPSEVQNIIELQLGLKTAILILQAALRREESRGAHFREDFPAEDDSHWRGHLEVSLVQGKPAWSFMAAETTP